MAVCKMSLTCKLVGQAELKSDANLLFEMLTSTAHDILPRLRPDTIRAIELHEGAWGKIGCLIVMKFILDGKEHICRQILEAIDEENKKITCKVVGGDFLDLYKHFKFIAQLDIKSDKNIIILTFEYEKRSQETPDPNSLRLCLGGWISNEWISNT